MKTERCSIESGVRATSLALMLGMLVWGLACHADNANVPDRFVSYVQATGSQYFDLGVVGRCGTTAEFDFSWSAMGGNASDQCLLGARADSGNTRFNMMCRDYRFNPQPGYGMWYNVDGDTMGYDKRCTYTADFQSAKRTLQRETSLVWTDTSTTYGAIDTKLNLYLFACNYGGTAKFLADARCYGVKIWQDGALRRNLKPCVKNGRGALYDAVNHEILYPQGGEVLYSYKPDRFIDYVESTGSQHVETWVRGMAGVKAQMDVMWPKAPTTDECFLGCRKDAGDTRFNLLTTDQNLKLYPGYGTYGRTTFTITPGTRYLFESDFTAAARTVKADGVEIYNDTSTTYGTFDSERSLYAFALNYGGAASCPANVRCHGLKIWTYGTLVRDFVPCDVGGRGVLFEKISGTVFPAQGAALVPSETTESDVPDFYVDYVQTDGKQYFDLGVVGRCGTKADFTFAYCEMGRQDSYTSDECLLGARVDSGNTRFNMMWRDHRLNPQPGYGMWYNVDGVTMSYGQRYRFVADYQAAQRTLALDDTVVWTDTSTEYGALDTGLNMFLCACNYGGEPRFFARARCYGVKMWQDGALVRDFKPCVKNGRGALFDDVSKRIFFPQGGEVIYPYKPDRYVEYIESKGAQFVDTCVVGMEHVKARMDMMWMQAPGGDECFLGCRKDTGDTRFNLLSTDGALKIYPGYGTYGKTETFQVAPGRRYVFVSDFAASGCSVTADGETIFNQVLSTESVYSDRTLYLFAQRLDVTPKYFAHARCYGLKIWQNGTLVRDFKPCVVGGVGALYERLSGCVFPVQGDGAVGVGEEVGRGLCVFFR